MVWFKIDDGLPTSRKVLAIPRRNRMAAIGLWSLAGAWAAKELTDGFVPEWLPEELGASPTLPPLLVSCGLWKPAGSGWNFHDWADHQPSKASVLEERAEHARRQKEYRDRKKREREAARQAAKASARDTQRDASVTHNVTVTSDDRDVSRDGCVTTARPDPTRPDPTVVPTELPREEEASSKPKARKTHDYPPDFEEFWSIYPRLEGKDLALRAWTAALKRADMADVMAGVKRYIDAKRGEQKKFLKTPAAWLNGGHWMDQHETTARMTFGGGDAPEWEM